MSYCPHADKIVDYCTGELTGKDKEAFEMHLRSCAVCQRELQVERAIEQELSEDFDPGLIESKVRMRLQLRQAQDARPFWLYVFRMALCGVAAAIAGFVLIPMLVEFLLDLAPSLSQYAQGVSELMGRLTPASAWITILGFCSITIFIASMYSLAQIRR